MTRPALPALATALAALLAMIALAPSAEAAFGMPDALTERGKVVGDMYNIIVLLGILVFTIVFVWLVIVIWRFRETTGHGRSTHERERHNIKAELAWFLIPLAIVLYIGYIAYAGLVELDNGIPPESVPAENHVLIEASQWNWAATYPGGVRIDANPDGTTGAVADRNAFLVPADTPILFNVTATDVIHAFQVVDANQAYVMFVDANPLGATKYNKQVARLPEGEYLVQCNKMCLNPGHAYMRARIKAVPQEAYDVWLNERIAAGRASTTLSVPLRLNETGVLVRASGEAFQPVDVVASGPGTRIVLNLTGATRDVTFSAPGVPDKTIRAGERRDPFFGFTVNRTGPTMVVAMVGDERQDLTFVGIEAEVRRVELGNFRFNPEQLRFEAGQTYLITLPNVHNLPHNLYIGHYNGGNSPEIIAESETVSGGAQGSMQFRPEVSGTFDIWCNVPGHAAAGMTGGATVT